MTRLHDEVPVLLMPASDTEVIAVAGGSPGPGWGELGKEGLRVVADLLREQGAGAPETASVRRFAMRPEDLDAWDKLRRFSKDGYAYGFLHDQNGDFAKNVAIKEVGPASSAARNAPIDPSGLANAVALAQIQASIEQLTERIEELAIKVQWTNDFLVAWQEGEVLAALETIVEVHGRYRETGKVGEVDWTRVAHLEQLLKTQHRRVLKELGEVGKKLRYRSFAEAKRVPHLDERRVGNLLALESYILRGLAYLSELALVAKAQRDELSLPEVQDATELMDKCMSAARAVAMQITEADTRMRGRSWYEQLMTQGLLGGALRDEAVEDAARKKRRAIRHLTQEWNLDALGEVGVLALEPASSAQLSAGPTQRIADPATSRVEPARLPESRPTRSAPAL